MKYYMRIFLLLYIVLLSCMVFWWRTAKLEITPCHVPHRPPRTKITWSRDEVVDKHYVKSDDYGSSSNSVRNPYMTRYFESCESFCNGQFDGYKNLFARLKNVILDIKYGRGKTGGENISDVLNQPENEEYFQFQSGFFRLPCEDKVSYWFSGETHLNKWLEALHPHPKYSKFTNKYPEWTVAMTRYEYANLYHTMTDFYNTFLVLKVFNVDPDNITVLWVDGHPRGALDDTWRTLFGTVKRAGEFPNALMFENMIWSIVGYESPLDEHDLPAVPFLDEFRHFFLSKHGVDTDYEVNCDRLNILLLWRHDYLAHPRNPSGTVSRKIKNEDELQVKISETFSGDKVTALQIDLLPMKNQLELISKTDILIGMHGAGLSHTLFLPRHAGLVEMFPLYYSNENRHFRAMAEWRHLHYNSWLNYDIEREFGDQSTLIDVEEIAQRVKEVRGKIC